MNTANETDGSTVNRGLMVAVSSTVLAIVLGIWCGGVADGSFIWRFCCPDNLAFRVDLASLRSVCGCRAVGWPTIWYSGIRARRNIRRRRQFDAGVF